MLRRLQRQIDAAQRHGLLGLQVRPESHRLARLLPPNVLQSLPVHGLAGRHHVHRVHEHGGQSYHRSQVNPSHDEGIN